MPTNFTEKVLKGESFEDFALDTASALSWTARAINERGETLKDAKLPDPANTTSVAYDREMIAKEQKRLKNALKMSFSRAAKKAQKEFNGETARIKGQIADKVIAGKKLRDMMKKVEAYQPPAGEQHAAHKAYMIDQLKITLDHDADPSYYIKVLAQLKPLTGKEWKQREIREAKESIASREADIARDIANVSEDVTFLKELKAAVAKPAAPKA